MSARARRRRSPGEVGRSLRFVRSVLAVAGAGWGLLAPPPALAWTDVDAGTAGAPFAPQRVAAQPGVGVRSSRRSVDFESGAERAAAPKPLRPPTHRFLVKVDDWMSRGLYAKALVRLRQFRPRTAGYAYEQSLVQLAEVYCLLATEQLDQATEQLVSLVDNAWVPKSTREQLRYNLVQIHVQAERWGLAAQEFDWWWGLQPAPTPDSSFLGGVIHFELGQYERSAAYLRQAIVDNHRSPYSEPQVQWYQLLLACYQHLDDPQAARALLRSFVSRFPGRSDGYLQLSHTALKQGDAALALASLELGAVVSPLSAEALEAQIGLLRQVGDPYRAAVVAESALEQGRLLPTRPHWDQLLDAWGLARESSRELQAARKAVSHFASRQTPQSTEATSHFVVRLAEALLRAEQYEQVAETLQALVANAANAPASAEARNRKETDSADLSRAVLLLGIAELSLGHVERSEQLLRRAEASVQQRDEARRWLAYWQRQHGQFRP